MGVVYSVRNWDEQFENCESRKVKYLRWVIVPNRHDGKGYRRLLKHPRYVDIFAAWCLILQVASRMEPRGRLVDDDGPLTAEDMADKTGFPADIFELAFNVLSGNGIGWMCADPVPGPSPGTPGQAGGRPGRSGAELNRREGKGIEVTSANADRPAAAAGIDPGTPDPATPAAALFADRPAEAAKGAAAKTRRKRRADPAPKPEHDALRAYFCEGWKARNGVDYPWKFGRDDRHAKWVLDQLGRDPERAAAVAQAFLDDDDPWLAEQGHDFGLLVSRFSRYRARPPDGDGFVAQELTEAEADELLRGIRPWKTPSKTTAPDQVAPARRSPGWRPSAPSTTRSPTRSACVGC